MVRTESRMKKIALLTLGVLAVLLISCDRFSGDRPNNYPNTRWSSKNPDIYFVVGENLNAGRKGTTPYAGDSFGMVIVDGKEVEVLVGFDYGALITFDDLSKVGWDSELGCYIFNSESQLFTGLCKFGKNKLVVTIENNSKGFLDDSVRKLVFVREDIAP
jgi:hypothetical protein